jgi:hypothetical protein
MVLLTRRMTPALLLTASILTTGCSTVEVAPAPAFDAGARWGLLPFINNTETPQAGLREESIVAALLRTSRPGDLEHYPHELNDETLFEPADRKGRQAALDWASSKGVRYALTGSVDEWRYKVGVDGEPAVGITMEVVDIRDGKVIWTAVGSGTGWSREALTGVAQKLTRKLIVPIANAKP